MADTSQPQDEELVERMAEAIWRAESVACDWKLTIPWAEVDDGQNSDKEYWRIQARAALAVARPLVAKAQREADVALVRQHADAQIAADRLAAAPLISEEGATRG